MTDKEANKKADNRVNNRDERVLIIAPTGRDAEMTARVLEEAGLEVEAYRHIREISFKKLENVGLILLAGEALGIDNMPELIAALSTQPPWSDIPLLVLTSGGGELPVNAEILDALSEAGNVTLIERPVRLKTLLSAVKSGLRARRRQYDIRDYIDGEKRTAAELKKLFKSERSARAEAESANRLKDEFLATVSHELRTPLNAMLGWTNLLRSGNLDADKTTHALETVERNARSQAQIIEDLLDVSRIITGKLNLDIQPLNATSLVKSAVDSMSPAAEAKNIIIRTNISEEVVNIFGDHSRLQQVLWNLLSNAVKFTPSRGIVEISLKKEESDVVIAVSDSGTGIAPEFLPYVFDRFRQADGSSTRHFGGLGLGLAIVRHLVEQHGGMVDAFSEGIGKGAKFIIKLPLLTKVLKNGNSANGTNNHKEKPFTTTTDSLKGLKVLLVDDEADNLELVKIFLESVGASVSTANCVSKALESIKNNVPDVIVSDIGMSGTNGYEFMESVRLLAPEKGGHVPAIALTAYARNEDREHALRSGYQAHVAKPVKISELVTTISNLAEHS